MADGMTTQPAESSLLQTIQDDHRSGRTSLQQMQAALITLEYMNRWYQQETQIEA